MADPTRSDQGGNVLGWVPVSRVRPCPICNRPEWCGVAADDSAAICMRTESKKPTRNGGWLHVLVPDNWKKRRSGLVLRQRAARDFGPLARQYANNVPPERLRVFADALGVTADALVQLGIGWTGWRWSFPMHSADRRVVGIRLRDPRTGEKRAEPTSRDGVFLTPELGEGHVLVLEGPTDTAAAIACGYAVIGRPDCTGGIPHVAALARGRDVVVVADADERGRRGAAAMASTILTSVSSVRIIEPPAGVKDLRAWVRAGATRHDIDAAIAAVQPRRLKVRFSHV